MHQTDDLPLYNLKAVVRETGLKPDTLRAWERRYGLPEPTRIPSGHRLYTQRDIEILKWLRQRLDEGLNISRAVALWRELHQREDNSLPVQRGQPGMLSAERATPGTPPIMSLPEGDPLDMLREQWIAACLRFDERSAEQTLATAFALFPIETVCGEVIQQGIARIGNGWYTGENTAQQEHFASALAVRRIETLWSSSPAPTRPERILIGCPPDEGHTFPALLLSLLLRRRGWDVVYLGASVPIRSLQLTVETAQPSLMILAAQQLHTAASLLDMAQFLLAARLPLAFGGSIFNLLADLQWVVPGHFLGATLIDALPTVEEILTRPHVRPAHRSVDRASLDALHYFQTHRPRIEAEVWQRLDTIAIPQHHLAAANANLGRDIIAALALGRMEYLGTDREGIKEAISRHSRMHADHSGHYLAAYYAAAKTHLDRRGQPIFDWFEHLLAGPVTPDPVAPIQQNSQRPMDH